MDYITGANKKIFLGIEVTLRIHDNEGIRMNSSLSPQPFTSRRGAPKPSNAIKAGSALSRGVVCM